MTSFQTTVRTVQGFGTPGDLYSNEPVRSEPFQLQTACTVGYMCSQGAQGQASAGGTGVLAGVLFNSKVYSLYGSALSPTLALPAYYNVELLKEGEIVIAVPADCVIGDKVSYNTTTGALSTFKRTATFTASQTTTVLTVTAVASGVIGVGSEVLDGSGNVLGTIISLGTGTGGTGTYNMDTSATVGSGTMTTAGVPAAGYADAYGTITRYTPNAGTAQLAVANFNLPY